MTVCHLQLLPQELLVQICSLLGFEDRSSLGMTCSKLWALSTDERSLRVALPRQLQGTVHSATKAHRELAKLASRFREDVQRWYIKAFEEPCKNRHLYFDDSSHYVRISVSTAQNVKQAFVVWLPNWEDMEGTGGTRCVLL